MSGTERMARDIARAEHIARVTRERAELAQLQRELAQLQQRIADALAIAAEAPSCQVAGRIVRALKGTA